MKPYYQDDWVTIYHGDCLEILPALPKVELVLTDPPYGMTSNKWDIPFDLKKWWVEVESRCLGAIILTASQPFTSKVVVSNVENFRHEWIWVKNAGSNFANTVREPMKEHESVLVFSENKWFFNKQMQERSESGKARVKTGVKFETSSENYRDFEGRESKMMPDLRVPSSVQKFNRERGLHPTQKPIALFEYMVKTYARTTDTVLDTFMGSGTTLLASKNQRRNSIGIEIEEKYCEIAARRMSQEVLI